MLFVPVGVENTVTASGSLPDINWWGKQVTLCEVSKGSSGEEGEGVIAFFSFSSGRVPKKIGS